MSRFEAAASISSLWSQEQGSVLPVLNLSIADQLDRSEPEHDLLSHSIHVRNLAYILALRINSFFPDIVDNDLVASSSMLHDWGKLYQQPTINKPYSHYVRSQFEIAIRGFPAIGSIAGRHNFGALLRDDPIPLEQMLLIYADIRSRSFLNERNIVVRKYQSMADALPEIEGKLEESGKYAPDDILKGKKRIQAFEDALRTHGIDVDNLTELPDGFTPYNRQYYNPPFTDTSPITQTTIGRSESFVNDLKTFGVVTLKEELIDKASSYRTIIKNAVNGDIGAAEKLALIDPDHTHRWMRLLLTESKRKAVRELHDNLNTYLDVIGNDKALTVMRVNYIKALGEFFYEFDSDSLNSIMDRIKKLFLDGNAPDDVSYHAAQVYGAMISQNDIHGKDSALIELWDNFEKDPENSYTPIALNELAQSDRSVAEAIVARLSHLSLTRIGLRGLNMYSEALKHLDSVDTVNLITRDDDGVLAPYETTERKRVLRLSYLLSKLLSSENRQIRIEATAELVNIHQRSTDPAIKLAIEGIFDPDKKHDMQYHQSIYDRLKTTDDPIEKQSLIQLIGRFDYGENKEQVAQTALTLLDIIDTDSDNDVKLSALQAIGRSGLAQYLTTDQITPVLNRLWRIFYFNPPTRALMPYFIAGIYAVRTDYPNMERDLDYLAHIIRNESHPDRHLQYEVARFFNGLAGAISDDNDPRIRLAMSNVLQIGNISPEIFELVYQKYTTRVLSTSRLTSAQKSERLMGNMSRKYISTPVGNPITRYLTYDAIVKSGLATPGTSKDVVLFAGTFDPIHTGSEIAAEIASQFVGDVYIQADSGNPQKQPKPREIRNRIIAKAIADQPSIFLFNDPQPFSYRKPEEYAELRRIFKSKNIWLLIGEDRIRTSTYYAEPKHYVYQVPHVLTIRSSNFNPCTIELREGKVFGEINPELWRYLQSQPELLEKLNRFHRIRIIGVPINFSSTDIKDQIERGVLRNVDINTRRLIARTYADESLTDHIDERKIITDVGELDRLRQDDTFLMMPRDYVDRLLTELNRIGSSTLPEKDECQIFYDPITGRGYLCHLKSLQSRTEKIIAVVDINKTYIS